MINIYQQFFSFFLFLDIFMRVIVGGKCKEYNYRKFQK